MKTNEEKVYCCNCKHWHPMRVTGGAEVVAEEHCKANPSDTYARPASEYAKPWFKNRVNDCKEFEAKE